MEKAGKIESNQFRRKARDVAGSATTYADGALPTVRTVALLVLIAGLAPHAVDAKGGIKVLNAIPDAYWGRWAPGVESCNDGDKEAVVLSAKAYTGPLGSAISVR